MPTSADRGTELLSRLQTQPDTEPDQIRSTITRDDDTPPSRCPVVVVGAAWYVVPHSAVLATGYAATSCLVLVSHDLIDPPAPIITIHLLGASNLGARWAWNVG